MKVTQALIDEIRVDFKNGMSGADICRKYNIHRQTYNHWRVKYLTTDAKVVKPTSNFIKYNQDRKKAELEKMKKLGKVVNTKSVNCEDVYETCIFGCKGEAHCDYIGKTGHRRPCSYKECTVYQRG